MFGYIDGFFQVGNMHLSFRTTEVTLTGLLDGFWLRCRFQQMVEFI